MCIGLGHEIEDHKQLFRSPSITRLSDLLAIEEFDILRALIFSTSDAELIRTFQNDSPL